MDIWIIVFIFLAMIIYIVRTYRNSQSQVYDDSPSPTWSSTSYDDSARSYRLSDSLKSRLHSILNSFINEGEYTTLSFSVKGLSFRTSVDQTFAAHISIGDYIVLEPEPDNIYDENAIKILYIGHHIGYVEKNVARYLSLGREYCSIAKVTSVSHHTLPFIDAELYIRNREQSISEETSIKNSISTSESLDLNPKSSDSLSEEFFSFEKEGNVLVKFKVKGTLFRTDQEIATSFEASIGDFASLVPCCSNTNELNSIKVIFKDALIGFVEQEVVTLLSKFPGFCRVARFYHIRDGKAPFIYAETFISIKEDFDKFPGHIDIDTWKDLVNVVYDDVKTEICSKLSEQEEGICYIYETCKLLRSQKEYAREKEVILKAIEKCKTSHREDYIPTFESRLEYVSRVLSNKEKREREKKERESRKIEKSRKNNK